MLDSLREHITIEEFIKIFYKFLSKFVNSVFYNKRFKFHLENRNMNLKSLVSKLI